MKKVWITEAQCLQCGDYTKEWNRADDKEILGMTKTYICLDSMILHKFSGEPVVRKYVPICRAIDWKHLGSYLSTLPSTELSPIYPPTTG